MPEGTILHLDKGLLIEIGFYMFNILLLVGVLAFLLYKPVRKYLAERRGRIEDDIASAKKMRAEAMELKAQYEQILAGVEGERDEILALANKKAVERSDELLFAARREADALHARAAAELELERKNAQGDMKEQIIEISALMAGRFVSLCMDKETQDRYVDEAFADWMDEA